MANIYRLKVDIKRTMSGIMPTFVQFDDARLEFQIFDDGKLLDLSGFTTVEFAHKKPNGQSVIADGVIETDTKGNKIVAYDYQGSEMNVAGMVETTFSILDANQEKISILPFKVNIVKDLRDEAVDPASQEYGKLQVYVAQLEALKVDMQSKIDESVQATSEANEAVSTTQALISDINTLKTETTTVKNETISVRDSTEEERLKSIQATSDALAMTEATEEVKNSTQSVQDTTELVRQNTESERLATQAVRENTETERLATLSVKDATQLVQDATEAVRVDTLAEKNATEAVRLDTLNVKDATEVVKNETILIKDEAVQTIADTNLVKDATEQTRLDTIAATTETDQATTEALTAASNAQSIVDNINYIGEYNSTVSYLKNNMVGFDGSSYIAIQDNIGATPTSGISWRLLARRGVDGEGSVASVNGVSPDETGNVTLSIANDWTEIENKPTTFTPSVHTHAISEVTGLTEALAGANTYTDNKVAGLVDTAPETLNTLNELAAALGDDPNFATTISNQVGNKVDKVVGKGLSTEDFTTAEKSKLAISATLDETGKVPAEQLNIDLSGINTEITEIKADAATHTADDTKHLQPGERTSWNGKQAALPAENRRKITFGTADPTGGVDGDVYFQYE